MKCGITGKVIFKKQTGALNRAMEILEGKSTSNKKVTPNQFRAYRCEYCGYWHLTGKN